MDPAGVKEVGTVKWVGLTQIRNGIGKSVINGPWKVHGRELPDK